MKSSKLKLTAAAGAMILAVAATPALAQTVPDAYGAAQPSEAASMNGGIPAESQGNYETETVEGTVGQLSYSPSANANGFYFENGTLVEAPPHIYIGGLVEEGSPVEVTGYRATGTFGEDVIHARKIVNTNTGESANANEFSNANATGNANGNTIGTAPAPLAAPVHALGGPLSASAVPVGPLHGPAAGGPVGPPLR